MVRFGIRMEAWSNVMMEIITATIVARMAPSAPAKLRDAATDLPLLLQTAEANSATMRTRITPMPAQIIVFELPAAIAIFSHGGQMICRAQQMMKPATMER